MEYIWLEGDLYKVITLADSDPLGCAIYRHGAGCHGCRIGANCHSTGLFHTLNDCAGVCGTLCVCVFKKNPKNCVCAVHFVRTCLPVYFGVYCCPSVCCMSGHSQDCVCGTAAALQRFNIRQCLPPLHLFYSSCLPQCSAPADTLSFSLSAGRVMCEVTLVIDTMCRHPN